MFHESLELLRVTPGGVYVDATFGGGGHSAGILERLGEGRLIAFDQDEEAQVNAFNDPRFTFVNHNFRFIRSFLRLHRLAPVDGILADLGVSSHQFDEAERGFSTRTQGRLDMRMDRRKPLDAFSIINRLSEEDLAGIFAVNGEIANARQLASRIVRIRKEKAVETTSELADIASVFARRGSENKYLAQVFQAIRMEVNKETEVLKDFLTQCIGVLKPGGRLVVISYHSLEDRLVKHFMKTGNFEGELKKDFYGNVESPWLPVTRKAIVAEAAEVAENSRARSAKLRAAEKN